MGTLQRQLGTGPAVRHAVLALLMLCLLFFPYGSSTIVASGGESFPDVAAPSGAVDASVPGTPAQNGLLLNEGAGAKEQTSNAGTSVVSAEQHDKGNLELLKALILEADATESEKLSDSQYL
ncbi:hypothetical protein, conserved [Eimeria maxima]|uniref:Transmembrane protein n=1 Tax=Eimeria maxima TaxID=5804 RepID=U6MA72_EIMMA|nr:hypothetical protein, conserved [Eimeria maxima]CDJ59953.1 hypothetical protein, conserved [Eimeria maxima]